MAARYLIALACLQVALANPLGYGGYGLNGLNGLNAGYGLNGLNGGYGLNGLNAGYGLGAGYGIGGLVGAPVGIVGAPCGAPCGAPAPCAPAPCAPAPCAPQVQIVEQAVPIPQPMIQEIATPVPQAVPVTIPNPTFLDANTRITTVSGSNGGEVQSTTTGSWDPTGPLPAAHAAPLVNANPWAYTAPQYPVLSPIMYGNSLFGVLA